MRCRKGTVDVLAAAVLMAGPAAAQLVDLQPGRNFVKEAAFGLDRSDDIGAGDVDADGDLDVVVANGSYAPQPNRIFINLGGVQGGTAGVFAEETASRFAGFPDDASRDVEFVDLESDGDLDLFISNNSGMASTGGEPSRFYLNSGGVQGGAIGWFTEGTDTAWGTLVSVPPADQVLGGNAGPFRGFSCDCDFADLDDDGDQDLFWSTYGPGLAGNRDSRIFLNDGGGVFDELWPWADPAADIKLHATDVDLADLDGDFDVDVFVSSRNTQARTYANNLVNPLGPTPFTDVTQRALIDTGAASMPGEQNYEVEYADADGDGDFDLWLDDYGGTGHDALLRNDGAAAGGGYAFTIPPNWLKQPAGGADNYQSFLDYDEDGDLDAMAAAFTGGNSLYTSSLAQGLDPDVDGLFHRNGVAGSLAAWHELPTSQINTSRDSSAADIDEDGDEDILVAADGNQQNWLDRNVLGMPDTHAPHAAALTQQPDLPAAAAATIHAAVRDNSAWSIVAMYDVQLLWSVDGGPESSQAMISQGGQQFRGVIPAVAGSIAYRVEITDLAGNTGVSNTLVYVAGPPSPWTNLGFALSGAAGPPALAGTGTLAAGTPGALDLTNAAPLAPSLLFVSLGSAPLPFKGGTLAAAPPIALLAFGTSGAGALALTWAAWPAGIPPGTVLVLQFGIADAGAVHGVALSNALQAVSP